MQTGMVQPSGPRHHFWISFGSVCARYTASGGAAKRLVTTMYRSPSVFSVSLLVLLVVVFIVFPFYLLISCRKEFRPVFRSFLPGLFAAWPAIDRSPPCRFLPDGTGALRPPPAGQSGRRVPAP